MTTTLSTMPTELVLEVQSLLPYASRMALRFTCRALYTKTHDPNLSSNYDISDLFNIETWPRYDRAAQRPHGQRQATAGKDFFACAGCLRIRSAKHFSNAMMKGIRAKRSANDNKQGRICIDCGVQKGVYTKGHSFMFGGANIPGVTGSGGRPILWRDNRSLELTKSNRISSCCDINTEGPYIELTWQAQVSVVIYPSPMVGPPFTALLYSTDSYIRTMRGLSKMKIATKRTAPFSQRLTLFIFSTSATNLVRIDTDLALPLYQSNETGKKDCIDHTPHARPEQHSHSSTAHILFGGSLDAV
ncbi:hypothetical protein EJ04DRAFT_520548 [Polyplosphaeria fusca]|uniref:F-box domain-containing protein n=1 Tax=Polyplosphaeria fusca TaxID=682080 RepID=A0A9P4R8D5_9PLEO|nr:hypothetical protein EJ04DRAFT_520548 [Polyplosphaeria fusca]